LVTALKEDQTKAVAAARLRYRASGSDAPEAEQLAEGKSKSKTHRRRSAVNRYLSVKARVDLYYRRRRGFYLRTRVKSWKEYRIERSSHDPLALTVLREEDARRLGRGIGGEERREARHERGRIDR
jgi:hypothetical protein